MKKISTYKNILVFIFGLVWLSIIPLPNLLAQDNLPVPDHIVVVFLENHAYSQIIGSDAAPYINSLAYDPYTVLFTKSYALEHPSQPNYLDFYSGCNQGVTDDNFPAENPFTTENLGRQLIDSGMDFVTYSEDLPYEGFNGASSGAYVRKHNPAANWMGTGTNQIPSTTNKPLTAFPSVNFNQLPEVSFVVPNQNNNMNDGADPERITQSDTWVNNHLDAYIQWAKTHNSLFILTFDEDNYTEGNRIPTLFTGEMVKAGEYSDSINHYSVLRTIEDMYGLPYTCNAASAVPITNCWNTTGIDNRINEIKNSLLIFPNPGRGSFHIWMKNINPGTLCKIKIYNAFGKKVYEQEKNCSVSEEINLEGVTPGVYYLQVRHDQFICAKKLIIQ